MPNELILEQLKAIIRPYIRGPGPQFQRTLKPHQVVSLFNELYQLIKDLENASELQGNT